MKIINLLFIIIFLFQSAPTFSMDEDEGLGETALISLGKAKAPDKVSTPLAIEDKQKENTRLKKNEDQKDTARSNDDCCTHWGLKHWFYGIKEYIIDRCLCSAMCDFDPMDKDRAWIHGTYTTDCCCVCGNCCDNPISGTLCFPLVATTHLLFLPCACCSSRRGQCYGTGSEEEQRWHKEVEEWRKERNLTPEQCKEMRLYRGLDDEIHLKNCRGELEKGFIGSTAICTHPAHSKCYGSSYSTSMYDWKYDTKSNYGELSTTAHKDLIERIGREGMTHTIYTNAMYNNPSHPLYKW